MIHSTRLPFSIVLTTYYYGVGGFSLRIFRPPAAHTHSLGDKKNNNIMLLVFVKFVSVNFCGLTTIPIMIIIYRTNFLNKLKHKILNTINGFWGKFVSALSIMYSCFFSLFIRKIIKNFQPISTNRLNNLKNLL